MKIVDYNNMTVMELFDELNNRDVGEYDNGCRILRKIQNKEYDDEVKEFLKESLQWYKEHAEELIEE